MTAAPLAVDAFRRTLFLAYAMNVQVRTTMCEVGVPVTFGDADPPHGSLRMDSEQIGQYNGGKVGSQGRQRGVAAGQGRDAVLEQACAVSFRGDRPATVETGEQRHGGSISGREDRTVGVGARKLVEKHSQGRGNKQLVTAQTNVLVTATDMHLIFTQVEHFGQTQPEQQDQRSGNSQIDGDIGVMEAAM